MSALPQDLSAAPNTRRVRFFRNGANQAVRIPREFELPGEEAIVRREGDTLIIEPVEPQYPKGSVAALQQALQAADTSTGRVIDGVAVVSAILGQKDVKLASEQLKEMIKT